MRMSVRSVVPWLAAIVVATTTGCSEDDRPRLVIPGENLWWGHSAYEMKANEPLTHTSELRVCLDRPGKVRITNVSMEYALGGLRVDAFAVKALDTIQPSKLPVEGTPLWRYGFDLNATEVDRVCPANVDEITDRHLMALGV
jgi:hypothetical protein